jgi:hypothetical protein
MKLAIIGSWRDDDREWGLRGSHADFEEACVSIGREIGRHRQVVIVGGESSVTADLHVVRGIVEAVLDQKVSYPLIEVVRPAGDSLSYEDLAGGHPGLFLFHAPTETRWQHLLSLREVGVVIAIAGMKGTYQAGLAAIIAKKKLVPVLLLRGGSGKAKRGARDFRGASSKE